MICKCLRYARQKSCYHRLLLPDSWPQQFSTRSLAASTQKQKKVNCSFLFGSIRYQTKDDKIVKKIVLGYKITVLQTSNKMFPEKFYFTAEPEKMYEIFSFLMAKGTPDVIFVSHFDQRYVCHQSSMKEFKLKFNQFRVFGTFKAIVYALCQFKL